MNTLRITPRNDNYHGFNLASSHPFFSDKAEVVFHHSDWGVSFSLPSTIGDQKTTTVSKTGVKSYTLCVYNADIQHGELIFDPEYSTNDELFFNYK